MELKTTSLCIIYISLCPCVIHVIVLLAKYSEIKGSLCPAAVCLVVTLSDNQMLHRWHVFTEHLSFFTFNGMNVSPGLSTGSHVLKRLQVTQANLKNCGPPRGNKFDDEKVKSQGMVPIERACHKDHVCQISMLCLEFFRRYEPG